ncbi:hypothetical protein FBQ81_12715 [Chloroflexi bacterium CFX6]|nr:hypothetical protein [Chloroflexi bacterium CFX6]
MKQIIDRKMYDTETATLIASDRYWDGSNFERGGRNTYLYKAPKGHFFSYHTTQWQGERDSIEALTVAQAKDLYEELPEHEADYEAAFGEKPEEA